MREVMAKLFLFLIHLFVVCQASALVRGASNLPLSEIERAQANKIRTVLSHYIYTLERPVTTFHYQSNWGQTGGGPTDLNTFINSSQNWGSGFFDLNMIGGDGVGPGHYVATDLTGSRSFGHDHPEVYVTVIKPTAKIIDGRRTIGNRIAVLKSVQRALRCETISYAHGHPEQSESAPSEGSLETWLAYFRKSPTTSCRKVFIQAVAELDISAILYSYSSANEFANCRHSRGEALSIISSDAFDLNQVAYFSDVKSFDPNQIGGFLKGLYNEGMQDYSLRGSWSDSMEKIPASLGNMSFKTRDYENWKASFIYKCGSQWKNESGDFPFGDTVYKLKDKEISFLKYKLTRAFYKKMQNHYFSINLMRGYLKITAGLAGVTPDVWTAAYKRFNDYSNSDNTKRLRETAKTLGEEFTGKNMTYGGTYLNLIEQFQKAPNSTFQGLAKMGIGPRLGFMVMNDTLQSLGAAPLVTRELLSDNVDDYSTLATRNKAAYVSYLRGCLNVYLDEKVTADQIMSGPCGLVKIE